MHAISGLCQRGCHMSDAVPVLVLGATGLVGQQVLAAAVGRSDVRLLALARREVPLPQGARMEVLLAPPDQWAGAIAAIAPRIVICALGTTIAQTGGDKQAFAAIDRDLVLDLARAAHQSGAQHFIAVSSVGAAAAASSFYLKTKGEMEDGLGRLGFDRLDILRPGLLLGKRPGKLRMLEWLGQIAAPLFNLLLHGKYRKYRAIAAADVAGGALQCVAGQGRGRCVHSHDDMRKLAGLWARGAVKKGDE